MIRFRFFLSLVLLLSGYWSIDVRLRVASQNATPVSAGVPEFLTSFSRHFFFFFFKSTFFAFQSQKLFHVDFFFVAVVVRLPILDLLASAYFYYDFVSLVCAEMDANRELIKIEEVES